jgi:hypothetical protein
MNDQPLVERPEIKLAERFEDMAKRLRHNAGTSTFGGACVIVPPGGVDSIEILILDSQGNLAQFFSTIQSRIQVALTDLQEKQRIAQGLGFR